MNKQSLLLVRLSHNNLSSKLNRYIILYSYKYGLEKRYNFKSLEDYTLSRLVVAHEIFKDIKD